MQNAIAYCGLDCSKCPSYLATQADDDEARAKTAAFYKKTFGFDVSAKDINCDGCKTENGRLLAYCRECAIKKCAASKKLANCALCADAPCDKLTKFHDFAPQAKESFEALMKN